MVSLSIYNDTKFNPTNYYVIVDGVSGKYADGWYGWDGSVHSEEQIFSGEDIPYKEECFQPGGGMKAICIGVGSRPGLHHVQGYLNARGL